MVQDRKTWIWLVVIFALGIALRLGALFNEFWYDEILSWAIVQNATHPLDIFTTLRIDNSHHFNSLVMYFLGGEHHWLIYRIPVFIAGIGVMILFPILGSLHTTNTRFSFLLSAVVGSVCFPFVMFATEARGYGYVLLFTFLAVLLVSTRMQKSSVWYPIVFWVCCVCASLSHATFIGVLPALGCYALWEWNQKRLSAKSLCIWFVPACILSLLVVAIAHVQVINIVPYNRSIYTALLPFLQSLVYPYWITESVNPISILIVVLGFATCYGLRILLQKHTSIFIFIVTMLLFFVPLITAGFMHQFWQARFALLPAVFILLLHVRVIDHLYHHKSSTFKGLGILFAILMIGTQLFWSMELILFGRDHVLAVYEYIQEAEKDQGEDPVIVGGNRGVTPISLQYYERYLQNTPRIQYSFFGSNMQKIHPSVLQVPGSTIEFSDARVPDWFIHFSTGTTLQIGETFLVEDIPFALQRRYYYNRPSTGWYLQILKRA